MKVLAPVSFTGESQWCAEQFQGGMFYWNDASPEASNAAEMVRALALGEISPSDFDVISNVGSAAQVVGDENVAVKCFREESFARDTAMSGLSYLRASTAMYEGLRRVSGTLPSRLTQTRGVQFTYQAPEMYAGFVPDAGNTDQLPIAAMSRVPGVCLDNLQVPRPNVLKRRAVYGRALAAVGLAREAVYLDKAPVNTLLHRVDEHHVQVTRLDISAGTSPLWPGQ